MYNIHKMNLSETLLRRILLTVILTGVVFSLALILRFSFKNPIRGDEASLTVNTTALYAQENVNYELPAPLLGLPVRLKIPGINVDAAIEYVGFTPNGEMGVPKNPSNAAWFDLGPRPGENGSAVIAGHRGWVNGKAAAFDYLYKLRKGDKLYIEDDKGTIVSFVVRETRRYDPEADASGVFSSGDGKIHLNLITCDGAWNKTEQSYSNRLVVFADMETE